MWSHLREKGIGLPKITSSEIDKQIVPVLRRMEEAGIKLDVPFINNMAGEIEGKLLAIEKKIYMLAGLDFNINSPAQMAEVLFDKLKLPAADLKKTKTGISTAAFELKKLESKHKIIKPILEYRELSKLQTTYLKPLPTLVDEHDRLHTHYGQDTSTGRITSSEPNLQNIPIKGEWGGEIRRAFITDEGNLLIAADYSQIELRVVACLADDTAMKKAFFDGEDIHTRTASEIFNVAVNKATRAQRNIAKTVNFAVLYGQSPYGLAQTLGIDQHDAAEYIKRYFTIHAGIKSYVEGIVDKAHRLGYVETLFGFKRPLPDINSSYRAVAEAQERMAINTPVQGTAAEILKLAMIKLDKELSKSDYFGQVKMLLTVHDEIVIEAPKKIAADVAKLVLDVMGQVINLCVPLKAEVGTGKNWAEAKKS